MADMTDVLEVEDLHASYGDTEVLHGVSISARADEIVTVIGPNGAGKSTLLKSIMGYVTVTQGGIRCGNDSRITRLRPDQRAAAGIAYVPQLENVFASLTVEENLRMGGYALHKVDLHERMEQQYETFPRLKERRRQNASTMSGGERQMIAMARALMTDPRVVLLDEPSAALSPKLAEQVFELVVTMNQQGRAIVLVEQDAERALMISHRGYALVNGTNALDGDAKEVLYDESLREAFLGTSQH